MAQTNALVWRHYTLVGSDEGGTAWLSTGAIAGKHVVAAGGFAEPIGVGEANDSSTSTSTDNATAVIPMVGTHAEYNSGSDTAQISVGFALAPGAKARAHVWCLLAPGETNS